MWAQKNDIFDKKRKIVERRIERLEDAKTQTYVARERRLELAEGDIDAKIALRIDDYPVAAPDGRKLFTIDRLARWMSTAPAELAGLSHKVGHLTPNHHANLVIFDTESTFKVTPEKLHYRHAISPYLNETLQGVVLSTWLRGEPVYQHSAFTETPRGRELTL